MPTATTFPIRTNGRTCSIGGPPERWRVHFPTKEEEDPDALTENERHAGSPAGASCHGTRLDIVGRNLYTVHQRVAQNSAEGRALLAGDSAHVNSPIGGMA